VLWTGIPLRDLAAHCERESRRPTVDGTARLIYGTPRIRFIQSQRQLGLKVLSHRIRHGTSVRHHDAPCRAGSGVKERVQCTRTVHDSPCVSDGRRRSLRVVGSQRQTESMAETTRG